MNINYYLVSCIIEEERRRVNGIARPSASFVRKETLKTLPDTHNSTFALRSTRNRQWAGHLRSESEIPEGSQRDFWLCCLRYFFRIPLSGNVYTIFFRPSAPRTAKLSSRKPSYGPVYPVDPPSLILYDWGKVSRDSNLWNLLIAWEVFLQLLAHLPSSSYLSVQFPFKAVRYDI